MNQYITGTAIRNLREQRKMTQLQLAEILGVSEKTVSKWETMRGLPDITLLEPISDAFGISVPELISGYQIKNANVSANMMRSKFYICPVCGNVIHSMGEAVVHCHGIQLLPAEAEQTDEHHMIFIERQNMAEREKLFAEADAKDKEYENAQKALKLLNEERQYSEFFKWNRLRENDDFAEKSKYVSTANGKEPVTYVDFDSGTLLYEESGYDDTQERRELEQAADMLFG